HMPGGVRSDRWVCRAGQIIGSGRVNRPVRIRLVASIRSSRIQLERCKEIETPSRDKPPVLTGGS
ncbi:MAG TPA: hypothetical protein PKV78_13890, partial [Methanoculleus thermophilus]|nr:hypothetical protein [Methanoculleus thermophilus]